MPLSHLRQKNLKCLNKLQSFCFQNITLLQISVLASASLPRQRIHRNIKDRMSVSSDISDEKLIRATAIRHAAAR